MKSPPSGSEVLSHRKQAIMSTQVTFLTRERPSPQIPSTVVGGVRVSCQGKASGQLELRVKGKGNRCRIGQKNLTGGELNQLPGVRVGSKWGHGASSRPLKGLPRVECWGYRNRGRTQKLLRPRPKREKTKTLRVELRSLTRGERIQKTCKSYGQRK